MAFGFNWVEIKLDYISNPLTAAGKAWLHMSALVYTILLTDENFFFPSETYMI